MEEEVLGTNEFGYRPVEFEILVGHPSGDIHLAGGYRSDMG